MNKLFAVHAGLNEGFIARITKMKMLVKWRQDTQHNMEI